MKNQPSTSGRKGNGNDDREVAAESHGNKSGRSTSKSDKVRIVKRKKKTRKSRKRPGQNGISSATGQNGASGLSGLNIMLEDPHHFPPLGVEFVPDVPNVCQVAVKVGGTTYYNVPIDDQASSLDVGARPFYSGSHVLDAERSPLTADEIQWLSTEVHTCLIADSAAKEEGYTPGDAYYMSVTLKNTNLFKTERLVREGFQQAVEEQLRLQQSTMYMPPQFATYDDFALWYQLEPAPGLIENKRNSVFLARHHKTGKPLVVRQIHDFVLRNLLPYAIAERWESVSHPNVTQLYSITTSYRSNEKSVMFAYDYHPNACTLQQFCHTQKEYTISETVIWSFTTQLVCGIRAVHNAKLAVRLLTPQRILVTAIDKCTVRINCAAIADVIKVADYKQVRAHQYLADEYVEIQELQANDLVHLGEVVLFMIRHLKAPSAELENFADRLISGQIGNVSDVMPHLGLHVFDQLDNVQVHKDVLEGEICRVIDNDRLFRLQYTVEQVIHNSLPQPLVPQQKSGNGPRYVHLCYEENKLIQLFGEFLHRQKAINDTCSVLNQLDAGTNQKIDLCGGQPKYIVSYRELKELFLKRREQLLGVESERTTSSDNWSPSFLIQSGKSFDYPFYSRQDINPKTLAAPLPNGLDYGCVKTTSYQDHALIYQQHQQFLPEQQQLELRQQELLHREQLPFEPSGLPHPPLCKQ
ncbi:PAN2-PAN3 deadenylation complex subunit PAN3-like isoform X1 [Varroa jacobsoni]|uniref:Protein kinase domain-containing protein n=1 Tax=Varroa destructor TaxID=109461 RepID=A0A7M7J285_VARDE|nr:PAN2-PAN3 deadenylation complex subunit PAN3-like isoform X2 [Varroa destructor]XP_022696566.1 PAN2-PAN3 deadenylation complex subunit PAN3-like isoform X1 [Varroa jacobsoni]